MQRTLGDSIAVITDRTHDDHFTVAVVPGPDVTIPLDRDKAIAYATTVLTAVAHAGYDAAVIAQLRAMGDVDQLIPLVVGRLRNQRIAVGFIRPPRRLRRVPLVGRLFRARF